MSQVAYDSSSVSWKQLTLTDSHRPFLYNTIFVIRLISLLYKIASYAVSDRAAMRKSTESQWYALLAKSSSGFLPGIVHRSSDQPCRDAENRKNLVLWLDDRRTDFPHPVSSLMCNCSVLLRDRHFH